MMNAKIYSTGDIDVTRGGFGFRSCGYNLRVPSSRATLVLFYGFYPCSTLVLRAPTQYNNNARNHILQAVGFLLSENGTKIL